MKTKLLTVASLLLLLNPGAGVEAENKTDYSSRYSTRIEGVRTPILKSFDKMARKIDRDGNRELSLQELGRVAQGFPKALLYDADDHAVAMQHEMTGTPSSYARSYPNLEQVYERMETLAQLHPAKVKVETVAHTFHNRPIKLMRLWSPETPEGAPKFLFVANQHAREWATCQVALEVASKVLASSLLDRAEVWLVPLANPDGYEYSHRVAPLWRKNRVPVGEAVGVDLNRNYPRTFRPDGDLPQKTKDDVGASDDPHSPQYRGESELSELETQAVHSLLETPGLAAVIDLHGFGYKVLLPEPEHAKVPRDRYKEIGKLVVESLGEPYSRVEWEEIYPILGHLAAEADALGIPGITIEMGKAFQPHPSKLPELVESSAAGIRVLENWRCSF